jgi:catechol 2,3-dioxygenase-like lactoylglutathione lyase family enzyme
MPAKILRTTPLFVVSDLRKSLDFYGQKLHFTKQSVWGEPPCFAMIFRDGFEIMLSVAPKPEHVRPNGPTGVWDAYLVVDDVALESFGLTDAGVPLASPLTKREYGMWELEVCDPDGYRICFGQDLGQ